MKKRSLFFKYFQRTSPTVHHLAVISLHLHTFFLLQLLSILIHNIYLEIQSPWSIWVSSLLLLIFYLSPSFVASPCIVWEICHFLPMIFTTTLVHSLLSRSDSFVLLKHHLPICPPPNLCLHENSFYFFLTKTYIDAHTLTNTPSTYKHFFFFFLNEALPHSQAK